MTTLKQMLLRTGIPQLVYKYVLLPRKYLIEFFLYLRIFGIKDGLQIYRTIRGNSSENLVSVTLPGYAHSFLLRKGTSDPEVFKQIFLEQHYKYTLPWTPRFIIDCGANNGYSTLYFAHQFPKAVVYAVEPELSNFELLEKNCQPYPNITCFQAGIWDKETTLVLRNPQEGHSKLHRSFQVEESNNGEGLRAMTINELLNNSPFEQIDLINIDIEGAEKIIFESDDDAWIAKSRMIFVESHDRFLPGCTKTILRKARKYNFSIDHQGENMILYK